MKLLKFLTLLIGIGAVVGALMMWIDPTGMMCGCEQLLEMLRAKIPNYSTTFAVIKKDIL